MPWQLESLKSARRDDELPTTTIRAVHRTFDVERSRYGKSIRLDDLRTGSPSCVNTSDRCFRCLATIFFASARACETVSVDAAASEAPAANNAPAATAAIGAATFLVHVLDIRLRARVTRKSSYRESNSFALSALTERGRNPPTGPGFEKRQPTQGGRIDARGGNDTVDALAGDDTVNAGWGHDRVHAGLGDDTVRGGDGADRLFGGPGNDQMGGGFGRDALFGGLDNDTLGGGPNADRVFGGAGNDTSYGGPGNDRMFGGSGDDTQYGGAGNDLILANKGVDHSFGGPGNDRLWAVARGDVQPGLNGEVDTTGDSLDGGPGDDRIHTRDGEVDTVTCGDGHDVAILDKVDVIGDATPQNPDGSCEVVKRADPKPSDTAPEPDTSEENPQQ